jgi:VIT1/CCC1 family predicted Fe2+/Mn2+ transporter
VAGLSAGSSESALSFNGALIAMGVEAVSMGAGEFISERGVHAMRGNRHTDSATTSGIVMSIALFGAGLIPILPIIILPFPHRFLSAWAWR